MSTASFWDRLNRWARNSVTLKLLVIGFLILILLIPASMLTSLVHERESIRNDAVREVSEKWGLNQTVAGPIISVPYEQVEYDAEGKMIKNTGFAHFLPDTVNISGDLVPQKRYRGIYVVVLYATSLQVEGSFSSLNSAALSVDESSLQWDKALFTIGLSDMAGVQSAINLSLNDSTYQFGPGTVTKDIYSSGASIPMSIDPKTKSFQFAYKLDINGSSDIYFTPFGKENVVEISSSWANPSFEGAFLPDDRSVSDEGFNAKWKVLQLNRNYPQQGVGAFISGTQRDNYGGYGVPDYTLRNMSSAFGLKLLLPIDEYQKTVRSAKYAAFFIFITFLAFFFIEVLNHKRMHPIQYLLIGAAIILFYILLLSISEHLTFNWAYLLACAVIVLLISSYAYFILKNKKLTFLIGGMLSILYGFFYSLLQLQDYALLLGSIGLLLILAIIMYLTRNVDWYNLKRDD
ncbi:MAG: cell envelope integrity protein CreD [Chitinophagales bacterium]|nr:cell envelope integrity protein CreD [Chitinophagales bacterium]